MGRLNPKDYHKLLTGAFEPELRSGSVPDFAHSPLNLSGELYQPIIDELWVAANPRPSWPNGKQFAVCLTHDVDAVSEVNPAQNLRSMAGLLRSSSQKGIGEIVRWSMIHAVRALIGLRGAPERFCEFEKWMKIEETYGARSTFFFAPERVLRPHPSDCMYQYAQTIYFREKRQQVQDVMRALDQEGWEIGLHPSWNAHAHLSEMKFQKSQIESILGHPIESVRQHFLKFDPRQTFDVQASAGFKYDSTLGFNDNVGFRRGTSYPFVCQPNDQDQGEGILQIPLAAQDGALLLPDKGLRLDPEKGLTYIQLLMEAVKEVGGVLTLSWHPHTMQMPGFWELYQQSLELVAREDPWFATVGQVGEWWESQADIDLVKFTADLAQEKKA